MPATPLLGLDPQKCDPDVPSSTVPSHPNRKPHTNTHPQKEGGTVLAACCGPLCGAQPCPTFGNPTDRSLPGSSVRGIFQARVQAWVAISYSRGSSRPRDQTCISCVSCIGRRILYQCITWEDLEYYTVTKKSLPSTYHIC